MIYQIINIMAHIIITVIEDFSDTFKQLDDTLSDI